MTIYIATSNPGKLRDFAASAERFGGKVLPLRGFDSLPVVEEDRATFAANARKKAEHYSRQVTGENELVLSDDSGLEVSALDGEPGVRSARYAAQSDIAVLQDAIANDRLSQDARNNLRLLHELQRVEPGHRRAVFVCVLAAARQGKVLKTFRGEVRGSILQSPRGHGGFGYDPLFYVAELERTMAELSPEERSRIGHRGRAFKKFWQWISAMDRHRVFI